MKTFFVVLRVISISIFFIFAAAMLFVFVLYLYEMPKTPWGIYPYMELEVMLGYPLLVVAFIFAFAEKRLERYK